MSMLGSRESRVEDRQGPMLIVGMGVTGLSVARHLTRRGIPFAATDSRAEPPKGGELATLADVPCSFGGFGCPLPLDEIAEAVVSPGISLDEPFLREIADAGIPIIGDIELFARAINHVPSPEPRVPGTDCSSRGPQTIAVTGSNGKSTVTALLAAMAEEARVSVAAGGNYGPPALDLLTEPADLYVLELSSFQLETTESLAPAAAVVLNVSADHIDRHGSLEYYAALKARIYRNAGVAVVNVDDARVSGMATDGAERVSFGTAAGDWHLGERGGDTWLCYRDEPMIAADALGMRGHHNRLNALAALALGMAAGLPNEPMCAALRAFPGLPHRCQLVATIGGVEWINDSKGTNVGAVLASLDGLAGPIVLLAGGQAKGADFAPVAPVLAHKGRAAVLFGVDAEHIARVLHGYVSVAQTNDLHEAVAAAAQAAHTGDTVLLSPGCASFDQFRDYVDRGEQFVAAVRELAA